MAQATQLTVNPAEEMIRVGPLGIRFLVTGENSNGSVAVFELRVLEGDRLPRQHTATTRMRKPSTS